MFATDLKPIRQNAWIFAGLGERSGLTPKAGVRPPSSPQARHFVAAAENAQASAGFDLPSALSVIGTFVANRPAEVFGICGAALAGSMTARGFDRTAGRDLHAINRKSRPNRANARSVRALPAAY